LLNVADEIDCRSKFALDQLHLQGGCVRRMQGRLNLGMLGNRKFDRAA